jgi:hypothetical protein
MAYVETEILTAMILQRFKVTVSPGWRLRSLLPTMLILDAGFTEQFSIDLTLALKNGLPVRVQRRE